MKWFRPHPYHNKQLKNDDLVNLETVFVVNLYDGENDPKFIMELHHMHHITTLYYDNVHDRETDFNTIRSM